MINEKIKSIICGSNDVWIMYSVENHDPYFKKFITDKATSAAVCIISKNSVDLLASELDEYNLKNLDCKVLVYNKNNKLMQRVLKLLKELNFPKNIYLNYSDGLDVSTDVLCHGLYSHITKNISEFYIKNKKEVLYHSADNIIYKLIESKSEKDIKYMKLSAMRALQIIEDVFNNIHVSMTEKDIWTLCHKIFNNKPQWFKDFGIAYEKFSWSENGCPIVLVGPNLKKGGHTLPSNQKLEKGYTVYLDFGVTLVTNSGEKYSSDLQRMGYCLKDGEKDAPRDIKRIFEVLKESIKLGAENCKPDKKGFEIDELVRKYILSRGYPDYNHSTGHPVGEFAHDIGTSLSPKGGKKSDLYLRENGVYTIEPRIQIENGGSLEEMIQVTPQGGIPLCDMQERLYLI
ncbi:MAG: aminopeptidase P family protein [Oscillospiraceae bacterium]|jgi:Xaa-Pro aminopeptidase|nr:aminopeptidase P family protein [Oscillospiraceae bacterium]